MTLLLQLLLLLRLLLLLLKLLFLLLRLLLQLLRLLLRGLRDATAVRVFHSTRVKCLKRRVDPEQIGDGVLVR
jgi:hypothetical protein